MYWKVTILTAILTSPSRLFKYNNVFKTKIKEGGEEEVLGVLDNLYKTTVCV